VSTAKIAEFVSALGDSFWHVWDFPYHHMGASITDASLQAGVNYKSVVAPRVQAIRANYPEVTTTSQFIDLTDQIALADILKWKHPEKLRRARAALSFFQAEGVETESDLYSWIGRSENKARLMRLRGIGPKTLDYYRMIAGHPTVAIDRHLFSFLAAAGVKCTDYALAHQMLTDTATILGRSASSLDYSIWKFQSERATPPHSCVP
jgi:hypothetical protein